MPSSPSSPSSAAAPDGVPTSPAWWRVGMLWLVISGPAAVVLAGMVTMVLAFRGADPPLRPVVSSPGAATAPATQARNHAATPPAQ